MDPFRFDRTLVLQVEETLNLGKKGWSPHAMSSLLQHIEARLCVMFTADVQIAMEFEILVRFAIEALIERYNRADFEELDRLVREGRCIIYSVTYPPRTQWDRASLHRVAKNTRQLVSDFIGASIA